LKIVLAVIAIGFLVFFLVSLYYSYTSDKDLEQAEASLEYLIDEINSGAEQVEIYNPVGGIVGAINKNWFILSWPYNGMIPNSCLSMGEESCICICEGGRESKFVERCDEEGTCLGSELTIQDGNKIKIEDPPLILTIDHENNKIIAEKEE
jgi:hypothetical protein